MSLHVIINPIIHINMIIINKCKFSDIKYDIKKFQHFRKIINNNLLFKFKKGLFNLINLIYLIIIFINIFYIITNNIKYKKNIFILIIYP